jgi:chemotaxis response regulator CheB
MARKLKPRAGPAPSRQHHAKRDKRAAPRTRSTRVKGTPKPLEVLAAPPNALGSPDATTSRVDFTIVGIGASAGGLEAMSQVLHGLTGDTGMAIVLVQHLAPKHESVLPALQGTTTKMPVV